MRPICFKIIQVEIPTTFFCTLEEKCLYNLDWHLAWKIQVLYCLQAFCNGRFVETSQSHNIRGDIVLSKLKVTRASIW